MIRVIHILKELFRNIFRNPGTTFSALLSMTLLLLLFDLFWISAGTSDRFYADLLSNISMEIYIGEEYPDSSLNTLQEEISAVAGVDEIVYISKDDARNELSRLVGVDLLVGYDTANPLPRSYMISFTPDYLTAKKLAEVEEAILSMNGISHVNYSKNWLNKAESTKAIILKIGMMLGGIILLTVLFSSANNMRLTARARAVGFYQMRLLGAGKIFLAMPFLIEGFLIGGLSAGIGWLIIFYWKDRIDFTQLVIVYPPLNDIFLYCAAAALLGIVSGYMGIRKLLRL